MTLRAIIVDDEPLARDELAFLLGQCQSVEVVGEAPSASEAQRLCEETRPEVAFVDLRMPGQDGLVLAEALRQQQPDLDVVIVSAHDDGAIRGFDARVTDYLLKPVRLERLQRTLERVAEVRACPSSASKLQGFAVRRRGAYVVVDLRDIVYFEAREELVWAVTASDRFEIDWTLASLAEQLDDLVFFQSHRGCIVRLDRIRRIEPIGARRFRLALDLPESPTVPLARDRMRLLRLRIPFVR